MRLMRGVAVLLALLGTACLNERSTDCDNGGVCPPGLTCAAVGDTHVCVVVTCGNGVLDPGEICDDGNTLSGDGCPASCGNPCGDGAQDPDEACDDGNTISGDGCSADCRSTEVCGNNVRDPGEECEDANLLDHDGCSKTCVTELPVWASLDDSAGLRSEHAAVFDRARGTMIVYGGLGPSNGYLGDTVEWDGILWRERTPKHTPAVASFPSMGYDPVRQRTVLYEGSSNDVWEWDGVDWTSITPSTNPNLVEVVFAFDSLRGRLLAIGQNYDTNATEIRVWDGTDWHQIVTANAPPPRFRPAVAYDAAHDRVVFFGGSVGPTPLSDTWVFDGVDWSQRSSGAVPPRMNPMMAYDESRGVTVLAGGQGSYNGPPFECLADAWEYDGSSWQAAPSMPTDRTWGTLVYDSVAHRLLAYGGASWPDGVGGNGAGYHSDILAYDGVRWTRLTPARPDVGLVPTNRPNALMGFDSQRGEVVLFGGDPYETHTWRWDGYQWTTTDRVHPPGRSNGSSAGSGSTWLVFGGNGVFGPVADTWRYVKGHWTDVTSSPSPPILGGTAMAYDPLRDRFVLFGGVDNNGTASAQTWEWNASTGWVIRTPATTTPAARRSAYMAYDPVRHTIVMFDGLLQSNAMDDAQMWEWNGTDWKVITVASRPPQRLSGTLTTDPIRNQVVLFGGESAAGTMSNETWEWNGSTWSKRTPVHAPPPTIVHASTFDGTAQRVVVFGGLSTTAIEVGTGSMWSWDGVDWSMVRPVKVLPPARNTAVSAVDSARGEIVMFGGNENDGLRSDTWVWTAGHWIERFPAAHPSARLQMAMAYDPVRHRTVLFGGTINGPSGLINLSDTWEWDGVTWQLMAPTVSPPARRGQSMTWDGTRGTIMMIGGDPDSDQWEYNGTTWSPVTSNFALSPKSFAMSVAYDQKRNRVLAFGAYGFDNLTNTTLEWDGSTWTDLTNASGPVAREVAAMVYDPTRGKIVMFGGDNESGALGDLWEWDGAWHEVTLAPRTPPARWGAIMGSDASLGAIVLFGGGGQSVNQLGDTWIERYEAPR